MAIYSVDPVPVELNLPSGPVLLAIAPLVLLVLGLVLFSLVDLVRAQSVRYLPKAGLALIIVLVGTGLGAIAYLVFGRIRRPAIGANQQPRADQEGSSATPHVSADLSEVRDSTWSPKPTGTRTITIRSEPAAVETFGLTRDYGSGGLFDVDL
jgi:hypothetical protein